MAEFNKENIIGATFNPGDTYTDVNGNKYNIDDNFQRYASMAPSGDALETRIKQGGFTPSTQTVSTEAQILANNDNEKAKQVQAGITNSKNLEAKKAEAYDGKGIQDGNSEERQTRADTVTNTETITPENVSNTSSIDASENKPVEPSIAENKPDTSIEENPPVNTETSTIPESKVEEIKENPNVEEQTKDIAEMAEDILTQVDGPEKEQSKQEISGIWQAWKEGQIDKAQRNAFILDALMNFVNYMQRSDAAGVKNTNYFNVLKGDTGEVAEVKPNEWQNYVKTDWQKSQELKHDSKRAEKLGRIQNDLEAAKREGYDKYIYNTLPNLVKDSSYNKMKDRDRVTVQQLIATANGAPFNADQLGNIYDAFGNAVLGNKIGDATLQAMGLDNVQKGLTNGFMAKMNELQLQLTNKQIDAAEFNNQSQKILNDQLKVDLEVAQKTKDAKIDREYIENRNKKYAGAKFKLNGKIPMIGEAGAEVDGAVLANAGVDIVDAIQKGLLKVGA